MSLLQSTKNYFTNAAKNYSTLRFIFEMTGIIILTNILLRALTIAPYIFITGNTQAFATATKTYRLTEHSDWIIRSITAITITPIWETLIQIACMKLVTLMTSRPWVIILAGGLPFAFLHTMAGGTSWIVMLISWFGYYIVTGIILAWTYYIKKDISFWHAFGITASIHALINISVLLQGIVLP